MLIDTTTVPARRVGGPERRRPVTTGAGDPVAPVRRRRSRGYAAAAVAAIAAGGLLSALLWQSLQHTTTVFVTSTSVEQGATITANELTTLQIAAGQPVTAFSPAQARDVVGKTAAVALPAGSLVTPAALRSEMTVPAGKALVGIALKSSQMPSVPLHPGDEVVLTPVANLNTTVTSKTAGDVPAVVADSPTADTASGATVVNVDVATADASDLAGRAAAGTVALYLVSGAGQ
jgi:hypothetical protein